MKLFSFFKNDLWKIIPNKEKPIKSFFIKIIRVIYFSIRSFYKDECYLKSALLTFYSLIAIVPFLALAMAIAKGFGFEIFLQEQILQTFKEQKDILNIAIHFAYSLITHIKSEVVAGLGVIFLFFSIFGLLENTEKSLNEIWKIKRKRSYLRKVIDYLAILIVCPIVFTASSSLTIFLSTHLDKTLQAFPILQDIYSYFISFFKILPFILSWLLFSLLYLFTPNTRIRFKPRLFAGFLAGTLFQLWQIGYIEFQLSISSYNAVYGSFAALPLFLIWLQINFVIFLYGAEIAAHIENDIFFYGEWKSTDQLVEITQKHLALLALHEFTDAFQKGKPPLSIVLIAQKLGISLMAAREIVNFLENEEIVAEIKTKKKYEEKYQLIINPELLTIKKVINLFDKNVLRHLLAKDSKTLRLLLNCFKEFDENTIQSPANLNFKAISEISQKDDHS